MGIVLYREGETHNVNGIRCDLKVVPPELWTGKPENGWHMSPEDLYGVREEKDTTEAEEEKEAKEKIDVNKLSNKKVRQYAEKLGIPNSDTARVQNLKTEIMKCQ